MITSLAKKNLITNQDKIILDDNKEWFQKSENYKYEIWSSYYLSYSNKNVSLFICKNNSNIKLKFLSGTKKLHIDKEDFPQLLMRIGGVSTDSFRFQSIVIANFLCSTFCSWKRPITYLQQRMLEEVFLKDPKMMASFHKYRERDAITWYRHNSRGMTSIVIYPDGDTYITFYPYNDKKGQNRLNHQQYILKAGDDFEKVYNDLKIYGSRKSSK